MRVLVTGSICNLDISFGELLATSGHEVLVIRPVNQPKLDFESLPTTPVALTNKDIMYVSNVIDFYRLQRRADLLVSISGGAINNFGKLWLLSPYLLRIPHVSVASGSDLSELIVQKNRLSKVYKRILKSSLKILTPPYPQIVKNLENTDLLSNTSYMRYPMLLPEFPSKESLPGPLRVLHATNLDWGVTDNQVWRTSTKGNDRFIRGILTALKEGADLQCSIAFRGPDRDIARRWIEESGFSDRFSWFDEVSQKDLQELIASSDIVVDQFDVGGFGLIALEAMNAGAVVMMHLDKKYLETQYGDTNAPVVNLENWEEISDFFMGTNREALRKLGTKAKDWVRCNHGINSKNFAPLLDLLVE